MFGPREAWLSTGAIAFYLGDSLVFLYSDELLLERVGTAWRPQRGAAALIGGRRPYLPNPLTPHRPLIQLSLGSLFGGPGGRAAELSPDLLAALAPVQVLAVGMLALFGVMPVVLYCTGTGPVFLGWMVCLYVLLVSLAVTLWRRRGAFELSRGEAAKFAFEAIACPPFAINIVRRITRRMVPMNLAMAKASLDVSSFSALKGDVEQMLAERMVYLDPATPAAEQVATYRMQLDLGDAE